MDDLALQIGKFNGIAVRNNNSADTSRCEVLKTRCAQPPRANHEHRCCEQALLPLDAEFVEEQMPSVAEELLVVHGQDRRTGGSVLLDGRHLGVVRLRLDGQALEVVESLAEHEIFTIRAGEEDV